MKRFSTATITIGIPVRNQITYVRRCLRSVLSYCSKSTQIVLIDDASSEPTLSFLREISYKNPEVLLLRNSSQEGFAFNANIILESARGDPVILLNSDTVITDECELRLARVLKEKNEYGLAGPTTSCSHTPQVLNQYRFDRFDLTDSEINGRDIEITRRYRGQRAKLPHLGGFCLAIARRTFKDVGFFDERFGLGPYEENDYCDRARRLGYECIWAKDIYVHHFGGRSFYYEMGDQYLSKMKLARIFYEKKKNAETIEDWVRRPPGMLSHV